jgi:uncharacterized tellurite resistance protein B-like protein
MLKALKSLFDEQQATTAGSIPEHERRHLQLAVASLLHEATRVDLGETPEEYAAAERTLADLFGLTPKECAVLLVDGREKAKSLTSYFAQVSAIKRAFPLPQRVRFIEHLWRVAYADGRLDRYEDHFVRKIAHLLYVPNTESMLARSRARSA